MNIVAIISYLICSLASANVADQHSAFDHERYGATWLTFAVSVPEDHAGARCGRALADEPQRLAVECGERQRRRFGDRAGVDPHVPAFQNNH
jgi:hypothetical protein